MERIDLGSVGNQIWVLIIGRALESTLNFVD